MMNTQKTEVPEIVNFKKKLGSLIKESQRPPFLFAGSGLSIRYISIPTWLNLLKSFVQDNKDCFKYEFGYYSSKCKKDPIKIASTIAEEFHEFWWVSERFKDNREKFSNISGINTEVAFKIELCDFIYKTIIHNKDLENEIKQMSKLVLSGILTTNWDCFIQSVFPDFQVEIGQKEALFADQRAIGELYKIHGCITKPETLVVTAADYENFVANNHYLNAKLLTLFAEYPIIFLGYSLSDHNIEAILKNLISCLDQDLFHVDKLKNRLFFVEWQKEPCLPTMEETTYTMSSISIPLNKVKLHDYKDLWDVLCNLPRTLPVKTLRQLQNMVFDFVTSSKPTNKVLVNGMEGLEDIENLEVVVGFGNIQKLQDKGIIGLKTIDLFEDILFDKISTSNYQEVIAKLLPTLVQKNTFVPFFKYQNHCQNLNKDNSLKQFTGQNFTLSRTQSINIDDYRVNSVKSKTMRLVKKYNTLQELIDDCTVIHAIQRIPYLNKDKIDLDVLFNFLKINWDTFGKKETTYSSHYRKCICLYDFLKFSH